MPAKCVLVRGGARIRLFRFALHGGASVRGITVLPGGASVRGITVLPGGASVRGITALPGGASVRGIIFLSFRTVEDVCKVLLNPSTASGSPPFNKGGNWMPRIPGVSNDE